VIVRDRTGRGGRNPKPFRGIVTIPWPGSLLGRLRAALPARIPNIETHVSMPPAAVIASALNWARPLLAWLSPALHASVRRVLRQAWELDDAAKAEKLIRNLADRLERDPPGVSKSILEGLDEILTVSRLGLPAELRRSLACTNIIENMMGTVRRVTRNVKRWSSPSMALRWTAAAMHEAKKGFRRLKVFKQLPALRAALAAHYEKGNKSPRCCPKREGRLTSFTAAPASPSSTERGAIPALSLLGGYWCEPNLI
jgi:hypothetical protein